MKFCVITFPAKFELVPVDVTHRGVHPGVPAGPGIDGGTTNGDAKVARGDVAGTIAKGGVLAAFISSIAALGRS
jgi:hypothetical protein